MVVRGRCGVRRRSGRPSAPRSARPALIGGGCQLEFVNRLPLISIETGVSESEWAIVWKIRMPRVVLGGVVGGMLSIAGASYQGVFRNPLVGPYLLGAAAGAGLGATLALHRWPRGDVVLGRRPGPDRSGLSYAVASVMVTYTVGAAFGGDRTGVPRSFWRVSP